MMKDKKQNKYDKAYLRIAKEWGNLSYCQRKKVGAMPTKIALAIYPALCMILEI